MTGGTDIGYDATSNTQQRKDNARTQLLNAIGRAGRAYVARRSMAIVVPNKAIALDSAADAMRAVRTAEFLQDDDASAAVTSRLDGLVHDALSGDLDVDTMSDSEQTAFSFLSFAGDREDAAGVIGKTLAVHRAEAREYAAGIAGLITDVGEDVLRQADVPSWVALAAHQSGIPLPETAAIYGQLRAHLVDHPALVTIPAWGQPDDQLSRHVAHEGAIARLAKGTVRDEPPRGNLRRRPSKAAKAGTPTGARCRPGWPASH